MASATKDPERDFADPDPAVITTTSTRTTTTTTTSSSSVSMTLDKSFFASPQGLLAVLEIMYSLIAFIVVTASYRGTNRGTFAFFMTVTFVVFFFTLCNYLGQLSHLRYKIQIPWTMIDMAFYSMCIVFLLISSSLVAARGYTPSHGCGATLGFVLMQFFVVSLGLSMMQYRATQSMTQQPRSSNATGRDNAGSTVGDVPPADSFYAGPGPAY